MAVCAYSAGVDMTQDEIIEMARRAGWSGIYSSWTSSTDRTSLTVPVTMQQIEAFAHLIAAAEREACAKIVEESSLPDSYSEECLPEIANDIRARGEQA